MTTPVEERLCGYCGEPFQSPAPGKLYCRPGHKRAANRHRHRGELTLKCLWCGAGFRSPDTGQWFCCPEHSRDYQVCEQKETYLTVEAAAAAALRFSTPLRGQFGYYRCRRLVGDRHWHLFSVDKKEAKRAAWLAARSA
jgi:hypothetical protein